MENKTAEERKALIPEYDKYLETADSETRRMYGHHFRSFLAGHSVATTQTNEILKAIEEVIREVDKKADYCFKYNEMSKESAYRSCSDLLDELLTKFKTD